MGTFLYRAVSLENKDHEWTGEPSHWVGSTIGRASGYLSRSSAVEAGKDSGVKFVIVRSEPVVFNLNPQVVLLARIADLEDQLDHRPPAPLRAVNS